MPENIGILFKSLQLFLKKILIATVVMPGIALNSGPLEYNDSDPQTRSGMDEATKSAPLLLNQGDVVDVGGCSDIWTIKEVTSFTGFLLHVD